MPHPPDDRGHPFSLYLEKGWGLRCRCKDCGHRTEAWKDRVLEALK